jgi:adenine-specific DNA-methyltransferase
MKCVTKVNKTMLLVEYHYVCRTTDDVGTITEKLICDMVGTEFKTVRNSQIHANAYVHLKNDVDTTLSAEFKSLKNLYHTGHLNGQTDFQLGNKSVSVKSNCSADKQCPQNIGQPSLKIFNKKFRTDCKNDDEVKQYFITNISTMVNRYLHNLFICDIIYFFEYRIGKVYKLTKLKNEPTFNNCTFAFNNDITQWRESNTLKVSYCLDDKDKTLSLGEVQIHKNRDCKKFRFNLNALLKLIEVGCIDGLNISEFNLQYRHVFKVNRYLYENLTNMDTAPLNGIKITLPASFSYIGSKMKLLDFIGTNIEKYTGKPLSQIDSFFDAFAGTGIVAYYVMQKGIKKVICNDIQHYSSVVSSVWTTKNIDKDKVRRLITQFNDECALVTGDNVIVTDADFVSNNYSPCGPDVRMYFTKENAYRIDKIRQGIEKLKVSDTITMEEYRMLIKILLYAVTSVSNTASVYGAYLKKFKATAMKPIILNAEMLELLIDDASIEHTVHNDNIISLLDHIDTRQVECCYIDSPYNSRGYVDNYHVLETISKYDYPKVKGKTGLRDEKKLGAKSFCSKTGASKAFEDMLSKLNSKYVFISYSSESIVQKDTLIGILKKTGWTNVQCIEKDYARFKSNQNCDQAKQVVEYIFTGTKV